MYQPTLNIPEQTSRLVSNKEDPAIQYFLGTYNRNVIHNMIIKAVHESSNGKASIGKQSDSELQVVMIHILQMEYNQHHSIMDLNKMVVRQCSDNILQNMAYYMKYITDLNTPGPIGASQTTMDLLLPASTRDSRERAFQDMI